MPDRVRVSFCSCFITHHIERLFQLLSRISHRVATFSGGSTQLRVVPRHRAFLPFRSVLSISSRSGLQARRMENRHGFPLGTGRKKGGKEKEKGKEKIG